MAVDDQGRAYAWGIAHFTPQSTPSSFFASLSLLQIFMIIRIGIVQSGDVIKHNKVSSHFSL